jgi:hypothetical protein
MTKEKRRWQCIKGEPLPLTAKIRLAHAWLTRCPIYEESEVDVILVCLWFAMIRDRTERYTCRGHSGFLSKLSQAACIESLTDLEVPAW